MDPSVPRSWEADVVLKDGHTVRVRPIVAADGERLVRFHERQSSESIYFRFFSPRPRLSERDVEHFTNVDHCDRVAFVAVLGDEIVGVARYERYEGTDTAEVAFFVDDAHHGRGLATVMLEYLAAAGRENGISRFAASTLPNNRKMLAVFEAAGYDVATHLEDGIIEVAFDIRPTGELAAAVQRRERQAEAASVRRLLAPASVAVIGSADPAGGAGGPAAQVVDRLAAHGFTGAVYLVWPGGDPPESVASVGGPRAGVDVRPSVPELPDGVDLAVICVPAADVHAVVDECGRRRMGGAVVLSPGLSEAAVDGIGSEGQVVAAARRHGMRIVGPNSPGLLNTDPTVRLHAMAGRSSPPPGSIGVLSESATLAGTILEHAQRIGLGVSTFVASGRAADVNASDLLSYWTDDKGTGSVLLQLASPTLSSRFVRAARTASLAKPVAALLTGARPPRGSRRSDVDRRTDAVFRQTGVIPVETLEQLFDIGRVMADQPAPQGRGVAVIGNSEGPLVLAADACVGAGLELVPLRVSGSSARFQANPWNLSGSASTDDYARAVRVAAADPLVHSVIVIDAGSSADGSGDVSGVVVAASAEWSAVTFATTVVVAERAARFTDPSTGGAVPVFAFPEHAVNAIGRLAGVREWRITTGVHGDDRPRGADPDAATVLVRAALKRSGDGGPIRLIHREQEMLLAAYGLTVAERRTVSDVEAAVDAAHAVGWPVALKARTRDRRKRTALGGVGVDIVDPDDLRATWGRMEAGLGDGLVPAVVQRYIEQGLDVAVRVSRTSDGAATVEVGLGGPSSAFDPWELGVLPLALPDASLLVSTSSVGRALTDPLDRVPVVALVHRLAALVDDVDEIHELVADPVVVSGASAWITDVDVVVGAPLGDLAVRRLD